MLIDAALVRRQVIVRSSEPTDSAGIKRKYPPRVGGPYTATVLYVPRGQLRAPPMLVYEERQVVDPIVFTNAAWINDMAQVVFGIRGNKIGVGNGIGAVVWLRFLG
jgi:hypothetical protein